MSEIFINSGDHDGLQTLAAQFYDIPTAVFPEGIPQELRKFGNYTTAWGVILPHPKVSIAEFDLLLRYTEVQPPFHFASCELTPSILAMTTPNSETGCWERYVYNDPKGIARYATISSVALGAVSQLAHRLFWQQLVGNSVGYKLTAD
ncbi:MAG: hypothetical protein AAB459_00545, partial [Patescibacteria group bacterium]